MINIGDIVRIKSWEKMVDEFEFDSALGEMYCGVESFNSYMAFTCSNIYEVDNVSYKYKDPNTYTFTLVGISDWVFTPEMVEDLYVRNTDFMSEKKNDN